MTAGKVRLSVLLPSLGSPKTLNAAVRSTLLALGKNDELLVLISGDVNAKSLDRVHDSRLRIFLEPRPLRVFEALNFLLEKAKGSLIGRMDSDDLCLPWRFRFQVRKLQKHKLDFVFSNAILFGTTVKPFFVMPQIPIPLNHIQSGLYLGLSNPFVHPTMIATKTSLRALGGYKDLRAEDLDLWLRGWQAGFKFARMAGYVILYRSHLGQVTQSDELLREAHSETGLQGSITKQLNRLVLMGLINPGLPSIHALEQALRKTSPLMWVIQSSGVKWLLKTGNSLLGRKSGK
jgi:glycosyltransferase involved in cell wall biosynthesis